MPFFIVTHLPEGEPAGGGVTFVNGLDDAIARTREGVPGSL